MAGIQPSGVDRAAMRRTFVANLAWAAGLAAPAGIQLLIEPINTRDMPGYFLNRQDEAHALVDEIGSPALKVQMDLYHCQIVEGDVSMKLRKYLSGSGKKTWAISRSRVCLTATSPTAENSITTTCST